MSARCQSNGDTIDRHRLAEPAAAQLLRRYLGTLQSDRRHLLGATD